MGCLSSDSFGDLLTGDFSSTFTSLGEPARVAFMSIRNKALINIVHNSTSLLLPSIPPRRCTNSGKVHRRVMRRFKMWDLVAKEKVTQPDSGWDWESITELKIILNGVKLVIN